MAPHTVRAHSLSLSPTPERELGRARSGTLTNLQRSVRNAFDRTLGEDREADLPPFLSPFLHNGQDLMADWSFGMRVLPDHALLDGTMGDSTILNVPLAINSYLGATKSAERAHFVGSEMEERVATIDRVRSVASCANGGIYIGVRGTTLASFVTGTNVSMQAPTLLGRVTFVFSSIGAAVSGFCYFLLGALCVAKIYNAYKFRQELEAEFASDPEGFRGHVDKIRGNYRDNHLGEVRPPREDAERQKARQEAISTTAELLRIRLQEAGYEEFHKEEREQFVEMLFKLQGLGPEEIADLGTCWKVDKLRAKRQLEFSNFVGSRLPSDGHDVTALQLKTEILAEMDKKFWINAAYLAVAVLGATITIMAIVASIVGSGGAVPIIVAVGFLICALTMMGLDGYDFYKKLEQPVAVAQFDKAMLLISTIMGAVAMVAAIVLIAVFSAGTAPLVSAIIIGLFWLSMNGFIWTKLPSQEIEAQESARRLREQERQRENLRALLMPVLLDYFSQEYIDTLLPAPEVQQPQLEHSPARSVVSNQPWHPGEPDSP